MNIKADVQELKQLNVEIKRRAAELSKLRKRAAVVEERIAVFLDSQQLPGAKYQNTSIVLEKRERRKQKPKKISEADAIEVLRSRGISNPQAVLDEILEARRGESTERRKIKIKDITK